MAPLASMPLLLETPPLAQSSGVLSLGSAGSSLWPLEALLESVLLLDVWPSPCRGRGSQPLRHGGRYPTGKPQEPTLTLGGWSGESLPGSSHWPGLLFPDAAENLEGPGMCHSSSGRARRRVRGSRSFGASRGKAAGFVLPQRPVPWLEGWPVPCPSRPGASASPLFLHHHPGRGFHHPMPGCRRQQ